MASRTELWPLQFARRIAGAGSAEFVEAQRRLYSTWINDSAVLDSVAASGDPAVAIIPEGPYVVPFYESS